MKWAPTEAAGAQISSASPLIIQPPAARARCDGLIC